MEKKSVYEMHIGEQGFIKNVQISELKKRHRFFDLGISPMARIRLLNKVNFNHLFVIEVDDVVLCIRKADAKLITVTSIQ